jgi:pimeloyl-ACP methyl ester carboxylesterase
VTHAPGATRRAALLALAGSGLTGCGALWRPSPVTMDLLHDDRACTTQAPVLLVLLPGANMTPAEMRDQGFVAAVRQRQRAVDVVVAGAGLQYVYDGSILKRLHDDVIAPYRARGYRRVWLAGISLGGFVAMGYALRHPGQVEGIVALAPYLGRRTLVQEVAAAGGPARWQASAQPRGPDDIDHAVWQWLATRPPTAPALHLGYGRDDRFAEGHALLAGLLPARDVQTVPGGHDWAPWQRLWGDWLDRGLLPASCID